jgi:hypothetical protein
MFAVRVQDKSIRELVQAFKDHAVAVTGSKSREASNSALLSMMGVLVPLNERIGEILRKLDEEF